MQIKNKISTIFALFIGLFIFQAIGASLIIYGAIKENHNPLYIGLGVVLFSVLVFVICLIIIFIKFVFKKYSGQGGNNNDTNKR